MFAGRYANADVVAFVCACPYGFVRGVARVPVPNACRRNRDDRSISHRRITFVDAATRRSCFVVGDNVSNNISKTGHCAPRRGWDGQHSEWGEPSFRSLKRRQGDRVPLASTPVPDGVARNIDDTARAALAFRLSA